MPLKPTTKSFSKKTTNPWVNGYSSPLANCVLASGYAMTREEGSNKKPDSSFFETKQRLIDEFTAANHELMELQNQQTQAVITHDSDFTSFNELIDMARAKKDTAKFVLIAHTSAHHC